MEERSVGFTAAFEEERKSSQRTAETPGGGPRRMWTGFTHLVCFGSNRRFKVQRDEETVTSGGHFLHPLLTNLESSPAPPINRANVLFKDEWSFHGVVKGGPCCSD